MKKAVVFVVLAMVVICSCAAQSATADQRIVGTWVCSADNGQSRTYVFNANGTGTWTDFDGEFANIFWGVSVSGELCFSRGYASASFNKYAMSPDGRRIFISISGTTFMFQKK